MCKGPEHFRWGVGTLQYRVIGTIGTTVALGIIFRFCSYKTQENVFIPSLIMVLKGGYRELVIHAKP